MDQGSGNHLDFAARIARIEGTTAATTQMLFVGADEVYTMKRRERRVATSRSRELFCKFLFPMTLATAIILGAFSHGIGQVLRSHIQGVPDVAANADVEMLVQTILGIGISMVLGLALGLNSRFFMTVQSLGVIFGTLFFHNAVHLYPSQFAALTSEPWVNQMLAQTTVNSLMWRGIAFVM